MTHPLWIKETLIINKVKCPIINNGKNHTTPIINEGKDMPHPSLTKERTCHTHNWTLTLHWTATPSPVKAMTHPLWTKETLIIKMPIINNGKNHTTPIISKGKDMPHPSLMKQRTCHTQNWTLTPHWTTAPTPVTAIRNKGTTHHKTPQKQVHTKEKTTPHPSLTKKRTCHSHH